MAILTGIGQLITCIENPIILLQHILGSSTQQLVLLVHDVGAQIVTQAQILGHLIVTQEEERDIVLEVVFLRTAHIIIGNDLAPVSARNAHSRVTKKQKNGRKKGNRRLTHLRLYILYSILEDVMCVYRTGKIHGRKQRNMVIRQLPAPKLNHCSRLNKI